MAKERADKMAADATAFSKTDPADHDTVIDARSSARDLSTTMAPDY